MSGHTKSLAFAAVLCVVCSLLLTSAAIGLKPFQQKNIALDMQKNILKSVGIIEEGKRYPPDEIEKYYADSIKSVRVAEDGRIIRESEQSPNSLPIYLYMKQDEIESYIIPIETQGLWGKISGYLAVKNDGTTITGFTVYKHSETPGLGGEIEKQWFQKNFEGKKITDEKGGFVSIAVAKGAVKDLPAIQQPHYVDGISGATLTGKFLSAGFKEILGQYEPVSIRFRKHELHKLIR